AAQVVGKLATDEACTKDRDSLAARDRLHKAAVVAQVVDGKDAALGSGADGQTNRVGPQSEHQPAVREDLLIEDDLVTDPIDGLYAYASANLAFDLYRNLLRGLAHQVVGLDPPAAGLGERGLGIEAPVVRRQHR